MADDDDRIHDRARKSSSREDDDTEEEGGEADDAPRSKRDSRDEESDDRPSLKKKAPGIPGRLFAAAAVSVAWGGLNLHRSCLAASNAVLVAIPMMDKKAGRQGGMGGGMMPMEGTGFAITIGITTVLLLLLSATLFAGGILLAMRKAIGQFIAMGVPVIMAGVSLIGFAVCAFLMRDGGFAGIAILDVLTGKFSGYIIEVVFSAAVAGCNCYLLLNKTVKKVLR